MVTPLTYKDPSTMTPLLPEHASAGINELVADLMKKSGALSNALNPTTREALVKLIEPMNSYYSNLIEGHYTHPLDIEKALKKDYSAVPEKRILQLESSAHIYVQKLMKEKIKEPGVHVCSVEFIKWLHKEFYKEMPDDLHFSIPVDGSKAIKIIPGAFRTTEVQVGEHVGPAAASLSAFFELFTNTYAPEKINDPIKRVIAAVASHHRLAWIHPFLDGNGRVVRLFTEAYFIHEGLDGGGLWSISRGLSFRNDDYYAMLHNADQKRWDNYDGRGNLSNKALIAFCEFMLTTAIDQVEFMTSLFEIDTILNRIDRYINLMIVQEELRKEAGPVLKEAFLRGSIYRGEMERLTGKSESIARKIMNDLLAKELLITKSADTKTPVYINFPVKVAPYLFPKLYPKAIEATL